METIWKRFQSTFKKKFMGFCVCMNQRLANYRVTSTNAGTY